MLAIFKRKQPNPIYYTSCSEVVFSAFVKAIVKQDFIGLVKSGIPVKAELTQAWDTIFNEYLILSGDTQIATLLSLLKDVAYISNTLQLIEIIVNQLSISHSPEMAAQLRGFGFRFQYDNGPNLQSELEMTITQSKQQLIYLKQAELELQDLRKVEGGAATEQDYEVQISAIEEFKGCAIDTDKYTVSRYCADIKRMKERYKPQSE
jgi:hypothetical protein